MSDRKNEEERRKPGRFAWVKKLIQSRNGSASQRGHQRHTKAKEVPFQKEEGQNQAIKQESEVIPSIQNTETDTESEELSYRQRPISQAPENLKQDNTSTLPVISLSTMSVRSSTFSEHSLQSTSATVTSDHPTLFTNASTVGIPPASIMDRRFTSITGHLYSTNNSSNHTFNTAMSPLSEPDFEH